MRIITQQANPENPKIRKIGVQTIMATLALAAVLLSCGDNSVNINGTENSNGSNLYCDFGPVTQYGGGCYKINYASECDIEFGKVVSACGNGSSSSNTGTTLSSSGGYPYSSSSYSSPSTTQQTANAVILTLTYWQTKDTDVGGLDPRIHFLVMAYQNGKFISANVSNTLLDEQDISATWTGSKRSSPVPFGQADSITIRAVVVEKDTFANDDISPGYYITSLSPFYVGRTGSHTLDYGSGLSRVSFNYEFVRQ